MANDQTDLEAIQFLDILRTYFAPILLEQLSRKIYNLERNACSFEDEREESYGGSKEY